MAKVNDDLAKKRLISETVNAMDAQIQSLEKQKQVYIEKGKYAKSKGLTDQYNMALAGLKMTIAQQKKVEAMKINFEISSQMNDMTKITSEFLKEMDKFSKSMRKITKQKGLKKVEEQFEDAIKETDIQSSKLESFMNKSRMAFSAGTELTESDRADIESIMNTEAIGKDTSEEDSVNKRIDEELEELKALMN